MGSNKLKKCVYAFLGFMLFMGSVFIYWYVEYIAVKNKVAELCSATKPITVYVSPEEWKKRVQERALSTNIENQTSSEKSASTKEKLFHFEGNEYRLFREFDNGIQEFFIFNSKDKTGIFSDPIDIFDYIYVDKIDKSILFREYFVIAGSPSREKSVEEPINIWQKIWLNNIPDYSKASWTIEMEEFSSLYTHYTQN